MKMLMLGWIKWENIGLFLIKPHPNIAYTKDLNSN